MKLELSHCVISIQCNERKERKKKTYLELEFEFEKYLRVEGNLFYVPKGMLIFDLPATVHRGKMRLLLKINNIILKRQSLPPLFRKIKDNRNKCPNAEKSEVE